MTMCAHAPGRWRGFTLLELLVAVTVLSIVSLIAWRGLDSLVHTRERLEPRVDEVRALLTAFGQIERDLAQVVNPSFVPLPAAPLSVRDSPVPSIELVRLAAVSPQSPSAVQVVIYEVRDGQLYRETTTPLDTIGLVPRSQFTAVALLADVRTMRVRVWQPGQGWAPAAAGAANPLAAPPSGLEVVLELADGKQYRRVLLIG